MNCNCIEKLKERIKTELPVKNKQYSDLKITAVEISGECFMFGENEIYTGLSFPITISHEPIRNKKYTKLDIVAKYCPLCGIKINEPVSVVCENERVI